MKDNNEVAESRSQEDKSEPRADHPDARRSRVRGLMARVERQMPAGVPLHAAWNELVDALALGPEPAVRKCPHCGKLGMLAATRCGHCWKHLSAS